MGGSEACSAADWAEGSAAEGSVGDRAEGSAVGSAVVKPWVRRAEDAEAAGLAAGSEEGLAAGSGEGSAADWAEDLAAEG